MTASPLALFGPNDITSLSTRAMALLVLIALLFVAAAVALWMGKRAQRAQAGRSLSALTGTDRGAHDGDDLQVATTGWHQGAIAGEGAPSPQVWQRAYGLDTAPTYPQARPAGSAAGSAGSAAGGFAASQAVGTPWASASSADEESVGSAGDQWWQEATADEDRRG